jgi:hypothetical protein
MRLLAAAAHVIGFDEHDTAIALELFDRVLALSPASTFALRCGSVISIRDLWIARQLGATATASISASAAAAIS